MTYPMFSAQTRQEALARLSKQTDQNNATVDALIVGGGIVGAGLARELAIRGIRPLLVEKNDFASGTSSRSSKLIHGGLRYLEMLDFHLVFESLSERHWLLKTHPHLVQPLEFNLPVYAHKKAPPGARSSAKMGVGLWLYDALSLFRTPFFHGRRSAEDLKKIFPKLRELGLKGSYYYADAMMLDDELVLETALDAHRRGATMLNYVKALEVGRRDASGFYEARLQDTLSPDVEPFRVRAKEVIICVGPWTEVFGRHVAGSAGRRLKPSQGVHMIVPWQRLPIESCLVMYAPDGRIIFAIPRRDLGPGAEMVIVGTTDSPATEREIEALQSSRADIDYLLGVMRTYFPEANLGHSDIAMTYAGVRPLLDEGVKSEAKTSREHEIWRNEAGIVFMAGGKYTTFRKISQEIADFAFPRSKKAGHDRLSRETLSDPKDYALRSQGDAIWGRFTDQWIRWKIEHHAPCTLEDIVFRRVPMWMAGPSLDPRVLDRVAAIARPYFGWTDQELASQKAGVLQALNRGVAQVN